MKKILLLAVMAVMIGNIFAQEPLNFEKVITIDSIKKDVIYAGLQQWIASYYIGIKTTTQTSDKDAGYIIKDGLITFKKEGFMMCYGGYVHYKLKFQLKNGRFKVQISDFLHETTNKKCAFDACMGLITNASENPIGGGISKSYHDKIWKELQKLCEDYSNKIFESVQKIKFNEFDNSKSDNW